MSSATTVLPGTEAALAAVPVVNAPESSGLSCPEETLSEIRDKAIAEQHKQSKGQNDSQRCESLLCEKFR